VYRPGDEHRRVVVRDAVVRDGVSIATAVLDGLLPLAEAVEGLPRVMVDLQCWLTGQRGNAEEESVYLSSF